MPSYLLVISKLGFSQHLSLVERVVEEVPAGSVSLLCIYIDHCPRPLS